ncbi:type II toxin-antitoxin system VapC family toxin [Allokutzneria sp. NRRL B-24872]|uniref:type II toxin-antitoxin system VapC family toxin n=1 Tax=Allokutzneria sp. NRRL B-24872 TaxID=1137961 RepID=UPI000A37ECBE|nr:type II toxin-antitoxin system VapC family toxin [Allokutzneria sp. NRRL B-24872]
MTVVLDASAVLALLYREPGQEVVRELLDGSRISTVNWSEVVQKLTQRGSSPDIATYLLALGVAVEPFTQDDAELAAALYSRTKQSGLSLGDRACLALAARLNAPALTADKAWAAADTDVEVRLIR